MQQFRAGRQINAVLGRQSDIYCLGLADRKMQCWALRQIDTIQGSLADRYSAGQTRQINTVQCRPSDRCSAGKAVR